MYYASLSKQAEKFIKKAEKELAKRLIDMSKTAMKHATDFNQ